MHPSAGGPPVVVARFTAGAIARGWQASVITTSKFCPDDGTTLQENLQNEFPIHVLAADRPGLLGLASAAPAVIDAGVAGADIVHLHTLWHPLAGMVRRACSRHGRPFVVMPHGMLDPWSLGVKALRKRAYLALVESRILRKAARIVFTTDEEERLARHSVPWLGAGVVVPLGADAPPAPRDALAAAFAGQFPVATGRRCLLFLGRIHPKKGLDRIINVLPQLIARYPDLLLIVAGEGEANYVAGLKKDVERGGCEPHVLFTGLLQGEIKWGALASAEALLLPSRQENFALVVAEAMHAGVPVILSNKVNTWPYVQQAGGGIVIQEADIQEELKAALHQVLDDPESARQMGEAGRAFASVHLTWEGSVERMIECYNEVTDAA
jgi:glycosyltransferase involved in cell wall biosynthesis